MRLAHVFVGIITLILFALIGRVIQLQSAPPAPIAKLVDTQQSKQTLHGRRGNLLDRYGRVLATTMPAKRLFVDPLLIDSPNTFAERLAYELDYDPAMIARVVAQRSHTRYVAIDHRLDEQRAARAANLHIPGVATQTHLVRDYPLGTLAGQLIGGVGFDGVGLEGVERSLEKQMTGGTGKLTYLRDSRRRPLWVERLGFTSPADGESVRLSLDLTIQAIAEQELASACQEFAAESGQMVIMDPHTGELLAVANYPFFDPTNLSKSKPELRRNRAVTDVFEPGSTFKPIIWAVATENNFANPTEVIDTYGGYYPAMKLEDAHPYDELTWDEVLVKSSNIGMAVVAERMPRKLMYNAVRSFGFGVTTGSHLPGETPGIVTPLNKWTKYSVSRIPMGHEIAVTTIQLARAFAVFANGGLLVTPTLRALDQRDTIIVERLISPATAAYTQHVLRRVITEGTGRRANSKLYPMFGKTGTAEAPDLKNGGYLEDQYISNFVCAAPMNNPRIVVVTVIQKPDKSIGHYGGIVAAPASQRTVERVLQYQGVPPTPITPFDPSVAPPSFVQR